MVVSIDIGTSYSSICMLGPEGKAQPIDISTGASMYGSAYSLPTAVFVEGSGEVIVGQAAMNNRKRNPQNFRMEFKRNLGEDIPILLGERSFRPEELYTEIFRHMKACAEKAGGESVEKAYLTCPASYGERQKERLCSAAKAAGLFDVELVDEPTAAAMCYCAEGYIQDGQTLLVYDFGGGTFDVSLILYQNGTFWLLTEPEGLEQCGGIDMDRLIFQDMLASIESDVMENLKGNQLHYLRFTSQLAELAVKAKHHLTAAKVFEEDIPIGFDLLPYKLTVERFNEMIAPLVGQTIQICRQAMEAADLESSDLSAVLLVGGTSRVPLVQEMVRGVSKTASVLRVMNLELAVVQGALEYNEYCKKSDQGKEDADDDLDLPHDNGKEDDQDICKQKSLHKEGVTRGGTVVAVGNNRYGCCNVVDWKGIVSVACGYIHTVGLREDGTVIATKMPDNLAVKAMLWTWDGVADYGQFNVVGWKDIVAIACGNWHTVGLRKNGMVVATGENGDKRCNVVGWKDIAAIACGNCHTVGLRKNGTVVATGENDDKRCNVVGWKDIVAIACGNCHTVGLRKNGTVVATGRNVEEPCNVEGWKDIIAIACGTSHTVGLKKDGMVVATGCNKDKQCNVEGWKDIIAIACGNYHTVGLRRDGTVVATGYNSAGQCNVHNWKNIVAVFCGRYHTIGIKNS